MKLEAREWFDTMVTMLKRLSMRWTLPYTEAVAVMKLHAYLTTFSTDSSIEDSFQYALDNSKTASDVAGSKNFGELVEFMAGAIPQASEYKDRVLNAFESLGDSDKNESWEDFGLLCEKAKTAA